MIRLRKYDQDRRMMKVAEDLGAPIRFKLRRYCEYLMENGRTEDMLAAFNRSKEKSVGVDIEAENEDADRH